MDHEPVLISTIAIGLTAAFVGGLVARRIGLPAIVGYLLAGIAVGPFTPGFIADTALASELAEIGVILLMFGVGIHFSFRDLLEVRSIAVPGALIQGAIVTVAGIGLGALFGWGIGGGLVLGLAIAIASTVVLLRTLEERNELDSGHGRIAVGWLIVEDLFTVLVLVLLPSLAPLLGGLAPGAGEGPADSPLVDLVVAIVKAAIFAILVVVVGTRAVPWLLVHVAREGSRELFTLAVLAVALGIAFAASAVFGVSLALGAFLAGAVVGESDLSHQAAADALPLRDAFAVLFFLSVGMLLDPAWLLANPLPVVAVTVLTVGGKAIAKFLIVAAFGHPVRTALIVAAGLAQIGEFSFILATLGRSVGLLPDDGFQLIVAAALVSITLNPLMFAAIPRLERWLGASPIMTRLIAGRSSDLGELPREVTDHLRRHAIICGYGRVGRLIGPALERRGFRYVVVTQDRREVEELRARGIQALFGDASNTELLTRAGILDARVVVVAIGDATATRLVVDRARSLNPSVDLVVRTHSETEAAWLRGMTGNVQAIHGERELAVQMVRYALRRFGLSTTEAEAVAQGLRGHAAAPAPAPRRAPGAALLDRIGRLVGRGAP